ncbi:hypothetical protein [Stenotrophomonas sp. MMGLT7]|uniref:hypothetical protein n=1 Tax=Stenotrophomonas sp. MMGLT7 TaxID=2901227 RepID=UPI001E38E657|nr:hypothetical protein [Stenotrophomonas sp. MMGLT7]MCD7098397.1 hypothetical protein [Stenotrophomonas sp. MMGLT7]
MKTRSRPYPMVLALLPLLAALAGCRRPEPPATPERPPEPKAAARETGAQRVDLQATRPMTTDRATVRTA